MIKSKTPLNSDSICSGVQNICESFWVNDLALSIPFTAPAASYLKSLAISAIRTGKSLYECKKFLYITMWCGQFIGLKT